MRELVTNRFSLLPPQWRALQRSSCAGGTSFNSPSLHLGRTIWWVLAKGLWAKMMYYFQAQIFKYRVWPSLLSPSPYPLMDDTWAARSYRMGEPHGKGNCISELPPGHYPPRRATWSEHLQCTSCERELVLFHGTKNQGGVLQQLALIILTYAPTPYYASPIWGFA